MEEASLRVFRDGIILFFLSFHGVPFFISKHFTNVTWDVPCGFEEGAKRMTLLPPSLDGHIPKVTAAMRCGSCRLQRLGNHRQRRRPPAFLLGCHRNIQGVVFCQFK
ncbi:hypothetical protein CEXT_265961 [Caerostris extrusa]|uniref:Uncharacterized protein n=1 Tax=Caerostris extrusa TaxID=172846 RepID=A0AAV4P990_CAEEX|nr:hypothetical protein CEXT_265961 [Caerostris extrusa]